MPFLCPECGQEHSLEEMEISVSTLPDAIEDLPEEEQAWRVQQDEHRAILDNRRFFLRAAIPVRVPSVEEPLYVQGWTEVSGETFRETEMEEEASSPAPGRLASEIVLLGLPEGLEVRLTGVAPGQIPLLEAVREGDPLARIQGQGMPLAHAVALYHALLLEDEEERAARFSQIQRRLVLERLLLEAEGQIGRRMERPPSGMVLPPLVGVLLPVEIAGTAGLDPLFLSGDTVEGVLAQADRWLDSYSDQKGDWGITLWDLDEERVAFTRLYRAEGEVEDSEPLPSLWALSRLLAGRGGYLTLLQRESGELEAVAGVILPSDSPRLPMLRAAASALAELGHAAAGFRGESEQGEEMWGTVGVGALELADVARQLYQFWIREGEAARVLGTSEQSARERLGLRIRQIERLFQVGVPILEEGEEEGGYSEASLEEAEALVDELEELNHRLGAQVDFASIAREMVEELEVPNEAS